LAICRELILKFDKAREDRLLSADEIWLHKNMKIAYLGLASLERTIAGQRSWLASLQDGDANTTYFHLRKKNKLRSISAEGRFLTDHADTAEAAFMHFDALLGTDTPRDLTVELTLELQHPITPSEARSDLDAPFDEEIWNTIKRMATRKAPSHDGFTVEFLWACWSTVKDFVEAFAQFHTLYGGGFHRLNQALLTLLPKKPDATTLGDYRPISLIHLVAKL
jgi:hypothetical protein